MSNVHAVGQTDSFVGQTVSHSLPSKGVSGPPANTVAAGVPHGGIHSGRRTYPSQMPPSPGHMPPSPGHNGPAGVGMGAPAQQTVSTAQGSNRLHPK